MRARFRYRFRTWLGACFVVAWGAALTYLIATMMIGHWVSMPHPEAGSIVAFANDIETEASQGHDANVSAFHFLYADCPCSRRILTKILSRDPIENVHERIVLIGQDPANRQKALYLGFDVDCVSPANLKTKYGVESVPLLIVANRQAEILYSGGYTSRKQGPNIQDYEIISGLANGESVDGLPLYGCAVSKELRDILDPLNIKGLTARQVRSEW